MKKQTSGEINVLRQKRFSSGNPDLGKSTAIPACTEYDLTPARGGFLGLRSEEFNWKSPKPGNCVRKDGRA
jgi:hypothetical protein